MESPKTPKSVELRRICGCDYWPPCRGQGASAWAVLGAPQMSRNMSMCRTTADCRSWLSTTGPVVRLPVVTTADDCSSQIPDRFGFVVFGCRWVCNAMQCSEHKPAVWPESM